MSASEMSINLDQARSWAKGSACACGMLLTAAAACFFLTDALVNHILLPLARLLSGDGIIDASTVELLKKALGLCTIPAAGLGLLGGIMAVTLARTASLPATAKEPPEINPRPITPAEWTAFSAVLLTAAAFRLPLMERGFIHDEIYILTRYAHGIREAFRDFWLTDHVGNTFPSLLSLNLLEPAGLTPEWAFRLPALLAGLAGITIVWAWIRKTSVCAALLATFWLALSPVHAGWSATSRGYSGYMLAAIISAACYASVLQHPTRRNIAGLTLINALGSAFHAYFLILPCAQLLHLALLPRHSPDHRDGRIAALLSLARSFLAALILWLPLVLLAMPRLAQRPPDPIAAAMTFESWTDLSALPLWPQGLLLLLLFIAGIVSNRKQPLPETPGFLLLLMLLPVLIVLSRPHFLSTRFFAGILPFVLITAAFGARQLATLTEKNKTAFTLLFLGLGLSLTLPWITQRTALMESFYGGFRDAARQTEQILHENPSANHAIIAVGEGAGLFDWYLPAGVLQIRTWKEWEEISRKSQPLLVFWMHRMPQTQEHEMILEDILSRSGQSWTFKDIRLKETIPLLPPVETRESRPKHP